MISGSKGSYNVALGIDPDFGLSDPDNSGAITQGTRTSGLIMPTRYEKFSTVLTGYPTFIIADPKDTNIYVITNSGQLVSYSSVLGTETIVDAVVNVVFDAVTSGTFAAATGKTLSHTPVAVTSPCAEVTVRHELAGATGMTVTYNGVAMTLVGTTGAGISKLVNRYVLTGIPAGASNVVAAWTGSFTGVMVVRTYTGVNQTTPAGTFASATGTGTTATVNAVSAVGELVVDYVATNQSVTVGAGQTQRYNGASGVAGGASDEPGAASVTMSWTMANSDFAISAFALKPSPTPSTLYGNGAAYYNNYIYVSKTTDINRYGPLSTSPVIASNVWTGATLGTQVALVNTTYPTVSGVSIPNHPMHVHGNNILYVGDYNNALFPGQGIIHAIITKKTTVEGDTNNVTTPNKLALPFGFMPTDIESYGTDLVVSAVQSTSSTVLQGRAALFFWDTTSLTFYRGPLYVTDPLITAMKSVNGELYVWSGNSTRGCRLSKYIGGDSLQEIMFVADSPPPLAGAVESWGSRIAWGGACAYPVTAGVVYAYGSKDNRLPDGLSIPIISTAGSTTPLVTAILNYAHLSFVRPKMIVGWGNGTTFGLDKLSITATYASVWRSELFSIDNDFSVDRLRIPLSAPVSANVSIIPKLYFDNFSVTVTLPTISTTLYSGLKKILYQELELSSLQAQGHENVLLEISFGGTQEIAVGLPIGIDADISEDENSQ